MIMVESVEPFNNLVADSYMSHLELQYLDLSPMAGSQGSSAC